MKKQKKIRNFRTLMLLFHLIGIVLVPFTSSRIKASFIGDNPIFFYVVLLMLSFSLTFYANTCKSPGYVTKEPKDTANLFFCKECQMHVPLRAAHCRICGKCILRRDHHCPWIGQCVGRDNHLSFFIWLIAENILIFTVFADFLSSIFSIEPFGKWIREYWVNIAFFPFLIFALFQVLLLFLEHSMNIMRNFTVWELVNIQKISYFNRPIGKLNPFNVGLIGNIKEFIGMSKNKIEWMLKDETFSLDDFVSSKYEYD